MGLYFCSIDSCKFLRLLSILIKFYKDTYQRTMKFFLFVHTVRVFKTIIKIIEIPDADRAALENERNDHI